MSNQPAEKITGAQVVVRSLEQLGVNHVFGYPGGANLPLFDALYDSDINFILTRHEQGATHMADGYGRATGKPGVALATSGPGASNTVTGLLTAAMDSIPLVVLTGQVPTAMLGKDAFQEADVFGMTLPCVKHSYLVRDVNDLPRVMREAFHLAGSGRPGPVVVDLPKDVQLAAFVGDPDAEMRLPGLKQAPKADAAKLAEMAHLLSCSRKPLLLVGQGAMISGAGEAVMKFAEKIQAPVTNTLLAKGVFPETHPLSVGMLGMHGTAYANKAVSECDLIFSIGSRWDDRIAGNYAKFCPDAVKLHIDIDPAEVDKVIKPDVTVVADAREALEQLHPMVNQLATCAWLATLDGYKRDHPLSWQPGEGLQAQQVIEECYKLTEGKAVAATDVGQHQMWAAQYFLTDEPFSWLSSGGAGTMGFGFPAAIGAQFARPDSTVFAFVGDGGFQMTLCELATAAIHKLPVKIILLDNSYLGMVRQWQELFHDNRLSGVDLTGNPDFVALAEAYGVKAFQVSEPEKVTDTLKEALAYNDGPCLVHCKVQRAENVYPMIPAGASHSEMILQPT